MEFFNTHITPEAISAVTRTLETGWLSEGAQVRDFEAALSAELALVNPVLVNSGTSALHLALAIAGIGPGDEVILPAQTFVATGLAILMQSATPVFCDIDPRTGNIDPTAAEEKITSRTKAIIPVHWGGYPCELDEINTLARQYDLAVIEDAAHALGAQYRGQAIGRISRFTAFSFQAIKHLTTGDGGALCCTSPDDRDAAQTRRWFGIDRAASKQTILGERDYDIAELGFKYHMNDLAASLGRGNLVGFHSRLQRRQAIAARYRHGLESVPGITLMKNPEDRKHAYWIFTILVEDREGFIRKLASEGIPASVVHLRIDRNSIFRSITQDLRGQEAFERHQISLPCHNAICDVDIDHILNVICGGW